MNANMTHRKRARPANRQGTTVLVAVRTEIMVLRSAGGVPILLVLPLPNLMGRVGRLVVFRLRTSSPSRGTTDRIG